MQREPDPQPTISTLRTHASTATNGLTEQNTMYKGAARPNIMNIFFAECSLVLGDINEIESVFDGDMETFVQHLIVSLFNKKFPKELSQIGGITLDKDSFADYFRSSNGKQLCVDKLSCIVTHSDGTKERRTKFRVWRDYGNAVYASWMRWFMGQEQAYRVFSTDNEEKLGDGLETVLGFFDVISYFGKELPKWGNVCQYRPMLEATLLKFVRENMTSHMTGLNRNSQVHGSSQQNRQGYHGQTGVLEPVHRYRSSGQKRKAGESNEDTADRGREPDHEPEAKQSRVVDIASRRAELLRMFGDLCDRAGELKICMKCGKESHEGTCRDSARATLTQHVAKSQCYFFQKGIPLPMRASKWRHLMMMKKWIRCPAILMTNHNNWKRRSRSSIRGRVPQIQLRREPLRDG